jgi:hypothetical protein
MMSLGQGFFRDRFTAQALLLTGLAVLLLSGCGSNSGSDAQESGIMSLRSLNLREVGSLNEGKATKIASGNATLAIDARLANTLVDEDETLYASGAPGSEPIEEPPSAPMDPDELSDLNELFRDAQPIMPYVDGNPPPVSPSQVELRTPCRTVTATLAGDRTSGYQVTNARTEEICVPQGGAVEDLADAIIAGSHLFIRAGQSYVIDANGRYFRLSL